MLCNNIFGARHGILAELANAENVIACKIYIVNSKLAIDASGCHGKSRLGLS